MNKYLQYKRVLLCALVFAFTCDSAVARGTAIKKRGWRLTWQDEFKRKGANLPDPSKWEIEIGGDGWGNNELEYYTRRIENSREENGLLAITATKEDYSGED